MDVKLLKAWSRRKAGHVWMGMHTGVAKTLIKRGFAEELKPKKAKSDNGNQSTTNKRASNGTGNTGRSKKAT